MAAYAALMSLMHTIDQIKNHHNPPISLHKHQFESITQNLTFLQIFLESSHVGFNKEAIKSLESRITDAARAAEDAIETRIVDQILGVGGSTSHHGEGKISSLNSLGKYMQKVMEIMETMIGVQDQLKKNLFKDMQEVMEDMVSIKNELMKIMETIGVEDQVKKNKSTPLGFLRSSNSMVGFDDVLLEVMDKLTGGRDNRQIIPIVGMGGIGKTTLARNVYENKLIKERFDVCAWTSISQEFNKPQVLTEILSQNNIENKEQLSKINEDELEETLYKSLCGRRYLVVLDDIWSVEVWEKLQFFFPDNNNGSRIMITTRLSNLASHMAGSPGIDIALLNEDNSWDLFSQLVFGEEGCPLELEEIGRKIVKSCRGLPLSIVVTSGLLAKSEHTQEYWGYIGENLNAIVNMKNDEHCLRILKMSYDHLPIYLKPCFLYMGIFEEDCAISVSTLVDLWVSEGFLKPISGKDMEIVGRELLNELVDRNLLLVQELSYKGNVKFCKIHDLLRDLCLREAQQDRFYEVIRQDSAQLKTTSQHQHRIVIPKSTSDEKSLDVLRSVSLTRSLICDHAQLPTPPNLRLLRILKAFDRDIFIDGYLYIGDKDFFLGDIFQLVNSRYLNVGARLDSDFPSSVYLLWNLQTLIVNSEVLKSFTAPVEIWNMSQLRHVEFPGLYLPDPPIHNADTIVMRNLHTLKNVINFTCSEEMVARIPNIKKLGLKYKNPEGCSLNFYRENLDCLQNLESIRCFFTHGESDSLHKLTFPHSLKKLTLGGGIPIHWEDVLEKVGLLPLLQKLGLFSGSFRTHKWETTECQFPSLKNLQILYCHNLEHWITESSHFPRLEHLVLAFLSDLNEIPSEIGEIPTLKSIKLIECTNSLVISTKNIVEEQEELYGEEEALHVRVRVRSEEQVQALQSLACPNFQVERDL